MFVYSYSFDSSPFSGHSHPFAIRRRRARRPPRRRSRSGQRRGATALFRSALDEGLAFKLATDMVPDLDELSHVKTPRSLAVPSRADNFHPTQCPDKGPSVPRVATSLHHCKESPDRAFRRINVRLKLCEALV